MGSSEYSAYAGRPKTEHREKWKQVTYSDRSTTSTPRVRDTLIKRPHKDRPSVNLGNYDCKNPASFTLADSSCLMQEMSKNVFTGFHVNSCSAEGIWSWKAYWILVLANDSQQTLLNQSPLISSLRLEGDQQAQRNWSQSKAFYLMHNHWHL